MTESIEYLTTQLITYIGNKRALLPFIQGAVQEVRSRLDGRKIVSFDVFSGSGIVARLLKQHSTLVVANDLERYAEIINRCYLTNKSEADTPELRAIHATITARLATEPLAEGLISHEYAPRDDRNIQPGERVFYTTRNARFLDTARTRIEEAPEHLRPFLLAPLLAEASVHANTGGVFKGFYKDRHTGIGSFGGHKGDALGRITSDIALPYPVFSNFVSESLVLRGDANSIAPDAPKVDLAYIDPPYNQHPYGSNYFMLNLLADCQKPAALSPVSGIPENWNRSAYNRKAEAEQALEHLCASIKASYLLISYNSEGFIPSDAMRAMLDRIGSVEIRQTRYNTFRASRNLASRDIHVTEFLFLVKKRS